MTTHRLYEFLEENDVKFIRLSFCDLLGKQYNYSVMTNELPRIFEEGQPIDITSLPNFCSDFIEDVWLHPDINSLSLLPWRPHTNAVLRFYCNIKKSNDQPFICDTRNLLSQTMQHLDSLGFTSQISTHGEFYLFKTDEEGEPTLNTLDQGGYLDVSPLDKGENIRREICLCLEEMGLSPESSHHEQGPGQNQIDFMLANPLTAADHFLTFKSVVKSIASLNGLFASFMPKPFLHLPGNALQLNINLLKNGVNLFEDINNPDYAIAQSFTAGILSKISEITLFLNTLDNSYERIGTFKAPQTINWSTNNEKQLIKLPLNRKDKSCIELRSADPCLNPYLAFTLILQAGIYGIENKLSLPDALSNSVSTKLPTTLQEAIEHTKNSDFVKAILPTKIIECYTKHSHFDYSLESCIKEKLYQERYFNTL